MAMTIEDKLGKNKFVVDNNYRHIEINKDCTDEELKRRVVMACPAKLYRIEEDGRFTFNYEGCLECGTCRVLAGGRAIKSWNHPMGGMGVWFRKG
jgi:ferredoxin like protein